MPAACGRPPLEDRDALLALNAIAELGRSDICRLAGAVERWLGCPPADLAALTAELGVSARALDVARAAMREGAAAAAGERRRADRHRARILTRLDPDYPPALLELLLPPPVLFVRGRLEPAAPGVAVVGSRRADTYGLDVARLFAEELAGRGLTVVSGFALGVDAAAHRGALEAAGGRTVAVLGSGLDIDYPRGHRRLAEAIAERGALVSEFPLGTEPHRQNFPVRNRLIAALSLGVLVVQAAPRSGSLVTARLATELGRDVYAVPAPIFDLKAAGPNALIRDGALAALSPQDIVDSLPLAVRESLAPAGGAAVRAAGGVPSPPPAREATRRVLGAVPAGCSATPERIAAAVGLPMSEVLAALLELELAGWLRREPGPAFRRRH